MMDARNFKNLTETEKTAEIKRMKLERELKNLKRDVESGEKVIIHRDGSTLCGCHCKEMTETELEKAKKRITELEKELSQAE